MGYKSTWYSHWRNAVNRCTQKSHSSYKRYGGVGIKCLILETGVRFLWQRDKALLMKRPSLDRIDNKGPYTLKNCRFIELSENIRRANHSPGGKATVMPKEHYDYIVWMLSEGFGVEAISRVVGYCDVTVLKIKQGKHQYQRKLQ